MRFRVIAGTHVDEDKKVFKKGEIVESDKDLRQVFKQKFELVDEVAKAEPAARTADEPAPGRGIRPLGAVGAGDKANDEGDQEQEAEEQGRKGGSAAETGPKRVVAASKVQHGHSHGHGHKK